MSLAYQDITNVSSAESTGLDDKGYSRPMVRTSFMVRGKGPFFVELPKLAWSAAKADEAVRAYATELVALIDKYPG